jgi:hypothetical protein
VGNVRNSLKVIAIIIVTVAGLYFVVFHFLSKVLFQSEKNQMLFMISTSIFLSLGVLIYSYFFKKNIPAKPIKHTSGKEVDWWDIAGKIFFPMTTIFLIFLFIGVLIWMAKI